MTNENTPVNGGIAQIDNLALCDLAIGRALAREDNLPGLVVFYGPSGFGKSISANFVAQRRKAYYVQAKSVWTKKAFLSAVLREMNIRPAGTVAEMADQVAAELAASQRPLIVDEFDHIVDKNYVELVRDLYEGSRASILLIGEEQLPQKLRKWERFHGRVLAWLPAQPVSKDDAAKLATIYAKGISIASDLLTHVVAVSHGSVRRVAVNLQNIREACLTEGHLSIDLATWGKRELYSGDAPKARRF